MTIELFYLHVLNVKRSSLHTRNLGVYVLHLFDRDKLKMAFTDLKSFWGFRETDPRSLNRQWSINSLFCKKKSYLMAQRMSCFQKHSVSFSIHGISYALDKSKPRNRKILVPFDCAQAFNFNNGF